MTVASDDFLLWLIGYCKKQGIPLQQEPQLEGYVKLTKRLLNEIGEITTDIQRTPPFPQHRRRTPEDTTEPPPDIAI